MEEIGLALPAFILRETNAFIRGGNSNYILDSDFESIRTHFPNATIETIPDAGHCRKRNCFTN
jgi:hypothetical protein